MNGEFIWMDGEMVEFKEAKVHALSHVVHYGSGIFEGIRAYSDDNGDVFIFRLDDHINRMYDGSKVYRMTPSFSKEYFRDAIIETVKVNKVTHGYIRPLFYRGFGSIGLNPKDCPLNALVAAWQWGAYLGEEALEKGISAKISSWARLASNTIPATVKGAGNYLSSQLIKMEALELGFDEGIALDTNGCLAEGSGENLFVIKDNVVYTTPLSSGILCGITRDTVIKICEKFDYKLVEKAIPREFLYMADEIFLTGTAAEITGVTLIDHVSIGEGKVGPITKSIQDEFFDIVHGRVVYDKSWLTPVK